MNINHLAEIAADCIHRKGKVVFKLEWDGMAPGASGSSCVVRWEGWYFMLSSDFEDEGPFETFENAMGCETFHFGGTPSPVITCTPKLADSPVVRCAAIDLAGQEGKIVILNEKLFIRKGAVLFEKIIDSRQ